MRVGRQQAAELVIAKRADGLFFEPAMAVPRYRDDDLGSVPFRESRDERVCELRVRKVLILDVNRLPGGGDGIESCPRQRLGPARYTTTSAETLICWLHCVRYLARKEQ